jgi:hypothetical protein
VLDTGTMEFSSRDSGGALAAGPRTVSRSPRYRRVLRRDFITVTKADGDLAALKPRSSAPSWSTICPARAARRWLRANDEEADEADEFFIPMTPRPSRRSRI